MMYCGKHVPWDHFPKSLSFQELQYPLIVLKQYFDFDWPNGHFKDLKTWRSFVIGNESYNHERLGAGKLLSKYHSTLKLLDALYVLHLVNEDEPSGKVSKEQLDNERSTWYWMPENLSEQELSCPYVLIKRIFKKIKPQLFRDYLMECIDFALSPHSVNSMTAEEIISLFKKLKKLISAAWIIRQRGTNTPFCK
ncbi:hypothetical protein [Mucilaginibacter sp. R-33]|uniref:hypothetical protein n=1 Tax=Mucilaginibacter sp. R-33 TaxID=3416711 RepID=UPI003CF10697